MKVSFTPHDGRYGYGFNYWCVKCERFLGNSTEDDVLTHPATEKEGKWFSRKEVPVDCEHAGEVYKMPSHEIEIERAEVNLK